MDLGQDHGQLHDLSSPILSKIQQAFVVLRGSLAGDTKDLFTDFSSVDGKTKPILQGLNVAASSCCSAECVTRVRLLTCRHQQKHHVHRLEPDRV